MKMQVPPLVRVSGGLDSAYLSDALRRAGHTAEVGQITITELTEGRQSNKVLSLRSEGAGDYVLKTFPLPNWRDAIFGTEKGEVALWRAGVTRGLPSPLHCPTIDIAHHTSKNEEWMLMEDVSRGIMSRGIYDEKKLKWLLNALAILHAEYWDKDEILSTFPLISLETHVKFLAEPIAALGGRIKAEGWIKEAIESITVLKPMVPVFLEVLQKSDADFYLDLCEHRDRWVSPLARSPHTLTHGDIRRANVSPLAATKVSLFDWDMASHAPTACDLAWFWFLHFWSYPPNAGAGAADYEALREYYIKALASRVGKKFDRDDFDRSWYLSWLKAFVQLGFCLIDPLIGPHGEEAAVMVRARVQIAVNEARRIVEKYVD